MSDSALGSISFPLRIWRRTLPPSALKRGARRDDDEDAKDRRKRKQAKATRAEAKALAQTEAQIQTVLKKNLTKRANMPRKTAHWFETPGEDNLAVMKGEVGLLSESLERLDPLADPSREDEAVLRGLVQFCHSLQPARR